MLLEVVLLGAILAFGDSVKIFIQYGPQLYFMIKVDPSITVGDLKQRIAERVNILPQDQQIIDVYLNEVQEKEGEGEFLNLNRLSDYGIKKKSKFVTLGVLRKVNINRLILSNEFQLSVVYADLSVLRVPLNFSQTIGELKNLLACKLDIPVSSQILYDFYENPLINAAGGVMVDGKTLADYGYKKAEKSKIISISTMYPNGGPINLAAIKNAIGFGPSYVQIGVPFNQSMTVLELRRLAYKATGIPPNKQLPLNYVNNLQQEKDKGIWKDKRILKDYGIVDGNINVIVIGRRDTGARSAKRC